MIVSQYYLISNVCLTQSVCAEALLSDAKPNKVSRTMRLGFIEKFAPALHRRLGSIKSVRLPFIEWCKMLSRTLLPRPWQWLLRMTQGVGTRSKAQCIDLPEARFRPLGFVIHAPSLLQRQASEKLSCWCSCGYAYRKDSAGCVSHAPGFHRSVCA